MEKQDALNRDAQAVGLSVEELVASATSLETSFSSVMRVQPSSSSPPTVTRPETGL